LVSRQAIWIRLGIALFVAGLGVFSHVARRAGGCRQGPDTWASVFICDDIGGYDRDLGIDVLHQGRAPVGRSILKYLAELAPGKVALWCYLIW
jgi:hypothetical protein